MRRAAGARPRFLEGGWGPLGTGGGAAGRPERRHRAAPTAHAYVAGMRMRGGVRGTGLEPPAPRGLTGPMADGTSKH